MLRICSNNLIESGRLVSAISATSAAATLPVSNLLSNMKSAVWRSTSAAVQTIRIDFLAAQSIGMVALCFTNLSVAAAIVVKLYTNVDDVSPTYTSASTTILNSNPSNPAVLPIQNNYAHGGGSMGVVYFPATTCKRVDIQITDTGNTEGYLQVGTCIVGVYWEPQYGFDKGETLQIVDESKHIRTESGDLITDSSVKYRKISFTLRAMNPVDRDAMLSLLRSNGINIPHFISLYANNVDKKKEEAYSMHCKLDSIGQLDNPIRERYNIAYTFTEL